MIRSLGVFVLISLLLVENWRRFIDLIAFSRKRRSRKSISFSSSLLLIVLGCSSSEIVFDVIDTRVETEPILSVWDSSNKT